MTRKRPRDRAPICAVCNQPRTFSERLGVWTCRTCLPHRPHQRDHVTLYEGVEVDST